MGKTAFSRILWFFILIPLVLSGGLLLIASLLPFDWLKSVVDSLSKDGSMQMFTPHLYQRYRLAMGILGAALLGMGVFWGIRRSSVLGWIERGLAAISVWINGLVQDSQSFFSDFFHPGRDRIPLYGLLGVILIAAASRLAFVAQPVGYDESYTFVAFASHPLGFILSDYHVPNNHVFHTILVYIVYHLFGNSIWVIRLPALLAGILIVPATYLVAASFFEPMVALYSASMVAASSILIEHSTNARGYTLVCLFWLLILALAEYLRRKKNRPGWALLVLFSVLGLYTIPIMLYPFGIVMTWLFLSWLVKDENPAYGRGFITCLLLAGLITGILTILLYMPIFLNSGVASVTSNRFVAPLSWSGFTESIVGRIGATWREWNRDLPLWLSFLFLVGLAAGSVLERRLSNHRVPLLLTILLCLAGMLGLQRVAPWPRVWLFLLPIAWTWAWAGLFGLFELAWQRIKNSPEKSLQFHTWQRAALVLAACVLTLALSLNVVSAKSPMLARDTGTFGDAEDAALFLKTQLQPGDVVLVVSPLNYPLRYYFAHYDIPMQYLYRRSQHPEFQRALVLVNPAYGQTLDSVLKDIEVQDLLDASTARVIHQYQGAIICEIRR